MIQFHRLSQERFDNIKVNFSGWKSSLRYWNRCVRYFLLHWEDDTAWPETWVRGWRVDTCGHNLSPDSRNGYNLGAGNYRRNIGGDIGANCAPRDGSWLRESIVTAGRGSRWPHHLFLKTPITYFSNPPSPISQTASFSDFAIKLVCSSRSSGF